MTLLFMDGFDVADVLLKWVATGNVQANQPPRFSGLSIRMPSNGSFVKKAITVSTKLLLGFAYKVIALPADEVISSLYGDGGATTHLTLSVNSGGAVIVRRGTTVLATSASGLITGSAWSYVEWSATIDATAGIVTVKVGGVSVISFTGNTKNGGTNLSLDAVSISSSGSDMYFDDLYVCDGLGSVNNAFLGDVRVQTLLPMGTGSSTQLTPTGVANNWDNVNDVPLVTTTFNASATVGQRDTYAMSDLIAGTGTIFGVQETIYAAKSDAGAASIKAAVKSGATVYYDATQSIGASVAPYVAVRETDPATAAAWTVANLNAMEFGAEVA